MAEPEKRLVYFGNDMLASCFDVFRERGWIFSAVYINPPEDTAAKVMEKAREAGVPVRSEKPAPAAMEALVKGGASLFFSAEYGYRIPLPSALKYGVNMHTSALPEGRGPTPLPYLVSPHSRHSALTLHKLHAEFDRGDIILKEPVPLAEHETLDALTVKMHLKAPVLLNRFLDDFEGLYNAATPQADGSYWPVPSVEDRWLDCELPVSELRERIRRFGYFGLIISLNDRFWRVIHAEAFLCEHEKRPGEVLFEHHELIALAIQDGFVCFPKQCLVAL